MTQICRVCKIEKDLSEFSKSCNYSSGIDHRCKSCKAAYHAARVVKFHLNYTLPKTKVCHVCKIEKAGRDFAKDGSNPDSRAHKCRECTKQYQDSRIDIIQKEAKDRRTNPKGSRFKAFEYLTKNGCAHCGESNPVVLEFHHLDPSTKIAGVATLVSNSKSWDIVKLEIDKCIVLCANCHRIVTAKEKGWYQDLIDVFYPKPI